MPLCELEKAPLRAWIQLSGLGNGKGRVQSQLFGGQPAQLYPVAAWSISPPAAGNGLRVEHRRGQTKERMNRNLTGVFSPRNQPFKRQKPHEASV